MKKASSILLTLLMLVSLFGVVCSAKDETAAAKDASTYVISNVQDYTDIAKKINDNFDSKNLRIKLAKDIEFKFEEFVTIGSEECPFEGVFDGGKHTIGFAGTNSADGTICIDCIFENVGKNGVVKNLTIGKSGSAAILSGAGIAKTNKGEISNCTVNLKIDNRKGDAAGIALENSGSIVGCRVSEDVFGFGGEAAGVALKNSGKIRDCRVEKYVISGRGDAAGISLKNDGKIINCFMNGEVVVGECGARAAGVVVSNHGDVIHCCVKGLVKTGVYKMAGARSAGIAIYNAANAVISDCQVSRSCCKEADFDFVQLDEGHCGSCGKFRFRPW